MVKLNKIQSFMRPLVIRDHKEHHRASTELELLFDLVVVIALSTAADQLRHEILGGHVGSGIVQFMIGFFLIWWPWNSFYLVCLQL